MQSPSGNQGYRMLVALLLSITTSITSCVPAFGQDQPRPSNFPDTAYAAPRILPEGCSAELAVEMENVQGTEGYRFLRRELEALRIGHLGRQQLGAVMASLPKASGLRRLVLVKTGITDAQNSFLCSSFLNGRETYTGEYYQKANALLTVSFNMSALGAWQTQNGLIRLFTDQTLSPADSATVIAAIHESENSTSRNISLLADFSSRLILDTSDAGANKVERITISCKERQALLMKLAPLANDKDKDAFTEAGEVLELPLQAPFKCAN